MSAQPKVILFTGAPPPSSVTPESCTISAISDVFRAFLFPDEVDTRDEVISASPPASTSVHAAAWRLVPPTNTTRSPPLVGFSQTHDLSDTSFWEQQHYQSESFFTTLSLPHQTTNFRSAEDLRDAPSVSSERDNLLNQFCEHSLAAHALAPPNVSKSPVPAATTTTTGPAEQAVADSFSTGLVTDTSTSFDSAPSLVDEKTLLTLPPHLSDVEDIPSASELTARYPQTITVNLIAGVLSIAQPKTVTTRWHKTLSLVEVLLGDETKAGFAVTFWLPRSAATSGGGKHSATSRERSGSYENIVPELQKQDVLLLQNVALHVFKGKVYGQSVRGGWTKVDVLWRRGGGGYYSTRMLNASKHPQQEKTKAVKNWVLNFVGAHRQTQGDEALVNKSWDQPPDDTQ